jgi:5'-nucleotidase
VRPLILLSNDDGVAAPGLRALQAALAQIADVIVCAPELNQSATSHSLSLHRILRLRQVSPGVFAVDGTPADCVYVALHSGTRVLPRLPDVVVSGMNHGLNLGVDVFYSGTVAAAREGALRGIPSIAVSAASGADPAAAAGVGAKVALALIERAAAAASASASASAAAAVAAAAEEPGAVAASAPVPVPASAVAPAPLLNVNVPAGSAWPVRATRLGSRLYSQDVIYREDPRGREYLWIGGAEPRHDPVPGSDTEAFDEGCVSVTPLTLDLFSLADAPLADAVAARLGTI